MDVNGFGIVALLGTVGAATGAISAVIVYTICIKHRHLSHIPGRGPLNWFEKDLLNRAEETQQSPKDIFISVESDDLDHDEDTYEQHHNSDNRESQFNDICDNITDESPEESLQYLSKSEDVLMSPVSSFAPPLPEGAVVATEKRIVIVKTPSKDTNDSYSNGNESETSYHKLSSLPSGETGGELQMCLMYDASVSILTVRLIEARGLHARELSGTAYPYAKIRLLPDWSNVWQTKMHRRTLNPVFDEDFVFEIVPESSLPAKTLEVLLYDFDSFSKHRCLGSVQLRLSSVLDHLHTPHSVITKPILQCDTENRIRAPFQGELMVSLSYQPSTERLTVIIVRAKNLPSLNDSKDSNLYVKVKIMQDGKRIRKKKSSIQHQTISPVWNDILNFDVNSKILCNCVIEFIILRANGELVAKCEVSDKYQKDLFQRVISGKGASAQWLPLSEPNAVVGI